jgi:phosphate transport system substrate-binding protein
MTWAILYENQVDKAKARELVEFLKFGLTEGQSSAAALDYAPLPADMVARLVTRLDTVRQP